MTTEPDPENVLLKAALIYAKSGFPVFPCKDLETYGEDEAKSPLTQTGFKEASTDPGQIRAWWGANPKAWIGGRTGATHCLDLDADVKADVWEEFQSAVNQTEGMEDLMSMLVIQKTPAGGRHLFFRMPPEVEPFKNEKLAKIPLEGSQNGKAFIETRGQGGYACLYPSPGYEIEQGKISQIQTLTETERDFLLETARSLDRVPKKTVNRTFQPANRTGNRPGDQYGQKNELPPLLEKHGWSTKNGYRWTRPGKKGGVSATLGVIPDRFYVFTSSTAFENETAYSPFAVYTILEHSGDYRAAARALGREGYGDQNRDALIVSDYEERYTLTDEDEDPVERPPTIFEVLEERRFDPNRQPPHEPTVYTLKGVSISRAGNLTTLRAQPGVGKSSFMAACLAAPMASPGSDCLGIGSDNPDNKAIIHLDTEQSLGDHYEMNKRIMRRAGIREIPDWFLSYGLKGYSFKKMKKCFIELIKASNERFGGIHAIFLDGIADMVDSPNNEEFCNSLVTEFEDLAVTNHCPIWSVIHLNPGLNETRKSRGHLGSNLERKAETELTLEKEKEIVKVWTTKFRKRPIFERDAFKFTWSDEKSMHVTYNEFAMDSRGGVVPPENFSEKDW